MALSINFYLKKDPKSSRTEQAIYLYIREKGKALNLHTGFWVNPTQWNIKKQEAKNSFGVRRYGAGAGDLKAFGSPELNTALSDFKDRVQKEIFNIKSKNPAATFGDLKAELMKIFREDKQEKSFFEMLDEFIKVRRNDLAENSLKKFITLQNHLNSFQSAERYQISFKSVNLLFFDKFRDYCFNTLRHTNNTLHKNVGFLKLFLTWAEARGVDICEDFKKFSAKSEKVDVVYLTEGELMKLYKLDLKSRPSFEKVRDVFCFACFTGQRFSDVSKFNFHDVREDFWNLRTTKTKDVLKIPLNEFSKGILAKYSESGRLPSISSQKTNQILKDLCKFAGIDELFSIVHYRGATRIEETFPKYELVATHTARRTFVTLSLEKGMRPETLMEITGHKDYKTFKKYIKITSTVKQTEMNDVWRKEPELKLAK